MFSKNTLGPPVFSIIPRALGAESVCCFSMLALLESFSSGVLLDVLSFEWWKNEKSNFAKNRWISFRLALLVARLLGNLRETQLQTVQETKVLYHDYVYYNEKEYFIATHKN